MTYSLQRVVASQRTVQKAKGAFVSESALHISDGDKPNSVSRERLPEHSWGSFQRFGEELEQAHEVSALIVPSSGV